MLLNVACALSLSPHVYSEFFNARAFGPLVIFSVGLGL